MAIPHGHYGQIIRFLTGDMDESEQKTFQLWREADPANELAFREVEHIWLNSDNRFHDQTDDTDKEWNALNKRLEAGNTQGRQVAFPLPMLAKIAAAILVVFLTVLYWFPGDASIGTFTIASQGEVQKVLLPDSSTVWLNANSSITYTEDFGTAERRISLEGEAFFDVRRNEKVPFIVATQGAFVRVLGTSFNLKQENGEVTLAVEEGVVRFTPEDSLQRNGVTVIANESAFIGAAGPARKEKNRNAAYGSWRKTDDDASKDHSFDREAANPAAYIHTDFSWKKNAINQSVIHGAISNDADHAVYENIVLLIRQTTARSKVMETRVTIKGPLNPGNKIDFEKRLGDILRGTRKMEILIESAEAERRKE